jgi:uncharacterized protein|tara:strand:- start:3079 stop:3633 length:555 start_codon:yes stop_codon:yes gene_type:complete
MPISEKYNHLPQHVDPRRLSIQGKTLTGSVDAHLCSRVKEAVKEINSSINVSLSFYLEDQGRKIVNIKASGSVKVICQRCLSSMPLQLECDTILCIVWSEEEADALPKNLEAWILPEDKGNLIDLIQDELLLALPFIAYHKKEECNPLDTKIVSKGLNNKTKEVKTKSSPFEVLKSLKGKTIEE